jgi:hypothetical protein
MKIKEYLEDLNFTGKKLDEMDLRKIKSTGLIWIRVVTVGALLCVW